MYEKKFQNIEFQKSAPKIKYLPVDQGYEVAFFGRSNAGKSSAINAITNKKNLAKTSKTPGRTAALNIFDIDSERRLVDVPGFGYARVSESTRKDWVDLINEYLKTRECLRGAVLVMDIRHPLKPQDCHFLEWLQQSSLPGHVILTKADKLSLSEQRRMLQKVMQHLPESISITVFSAKDKLGVTEVQKILLDWYCL
ncbi:MAG: ribosome biogenesis GTP-binding protein YihA/YsxC [Pseudomonadota bacterium]|nr:ribosome biogenesis GTP-binding protein YihA/YsxC [Pseudomonadota bacterium]